jgi:hypothetical protein
VPRSVPVVVKLWLRVSSLKPRSVLQEDDGAGASSWAEALVRPRIKWKVCLLGVRERKDSETSVKGHRIDVPDIVEQRHI